MKRILSLVITLLMLLSMAACGGEADAELKKPADVSVNDSAETKPDEMKSVETTLPAKVEPTVAETVLVDEAGVKITAKSFEMDDIFGPALKILIENNSDVDLTVQARNSSVNGYMVENMLSADVASGKKTNDEIVFMASDLEACGIETVADMEFSFHIFTTEDWEAYLDTDQIQIKTAAAETYEYTYDDSGDIAYEGNDVKIVVKGLSEADSLFGPSIVVYIENNGDQAFTVQARDVSVNGFMVDALFSTDVMPGKRAVDTITFLSEELEENDITAIEAVELSFTVFDFVGWDTIVDTDTVTISFE